MQLSVSTGDGVLDLRIGKLLIGTVYGRQAHDGGHPLSPQQAAANAARLAACWNACEGVSTENLQPGDVHRLILDLGEARQANAALLKGVLAAAGQALRSYQYGNASTELAEEIADAVDAAIAKAKEGV
jgi:hypothetical protein